MKPTWKLLIVNGVLGLAFLLGSPQITCGQTSSTSDIKQLQADYDAKLDRWRDTIKQIRATGIRYMDSDDAAGAKDLRKEWNSLREQGRAQQEDLIDAATALYKALKNPSADLSALLARIQAKKLKAGFPDEAYELGQLLLKQFPKDSEIQFATAKAAIYTNHFEEANTFAQGYGTMLQGDKSIATRFLFPQLSELRSKFKREQELRAAEESSDDPLPLVTFETSQGQIVVELFENEAPSTVANFINLVEEGQYNGMLIHRVIKNYIAQTGEKFVNGKFAAPDYSIYDECKEDDARFHFRGSLSMAKTHQADSANTQFFFCHRALPHLDGIHTVFGRIVSGWDTLNRLTHTHFHNDKDEEEAIKEATLDYIISAKVTRKRDHAYEVQKIPRR